MACDPQTLITQASCIQCQIPDGMKLPVLIYLFCQILANGGTGGGGSQLVPYTVAPPPNPTNTALPALAYDPNGILPVLGWNTTTLTWN